MEVEEQTQRNDKEGTEETRTEKRFNKWVKCMPESFKKVFMREGDEYAKLVVDKIINGVQLRDELVLSHAFKDFSLYIPYKYNTIYHFDDFKIIKAYIKHKTSPRRKRQARESVHDAH